MPKPAVLAGVGVVGLVVIVGGVVAITNKKDDPVSNNSTSVVGAKNDDAKLNDPEGVYDYFSDPSITKFPEKNVSFGNGQTLTFEYDGSKTNNDPAATLSYQLYYIQDDGKVQPMGGGNVEGKGSGVFTLSDKVFNSSAKDRSGFLELQGTSGTSISSSGQITGTNVKLGMYPVTFDIAD